MISAYLSLMIQIHEKEKLREDEFMNFSNQLRNNASRSHQKIQE